MTQNTIETIQFISFIILFIGIFALLIYAFVRIIEHFVDKRTKIKREHFNKWFSTLTPEQQQQYIIQRKATTDALKEAGYHNGSNTTIF